MTTATANKSLSEMTEAELDAMDVEAERMMADDAADPEYIADEAECAAAMEDQDELEARLTMVRVRITWVDAQGNAACIGFDETVWADDLEQATDAALYHGECSGIDLGLYHPVAELA
jgi:hypothetical protein